MHDRIYSWGHSKRYNDYSNYFKSKFDQRVQKISVDAGFTCPNRNGTKAFGGCLFCDNKTFMPFYCSPDISITTQLHEGKEFFAKKYKTQKYLAYFQSFSNTFASLDRLKVLYEEALSVEGVVGLVIATRPDCVNKAKLDYLEELAKKYTIILEYGVESCYNETLALVNRGHTFEESVRAIKGSSGRGIQIGIHMIVGFPGEDRDSIIDEADILSELPIDSIKMHHLQIIKGTKFAKLYQKDPNMFNLYGVDEYIDLLAEFIERLDPRIVLERFINQSPLDMLVAPKWDGLTNNEFTAKLDKKLKEWDVWQGKKFGAEREI